LGTEIAYTLFQNPLTRFFVNQIIAYHKANIDCQRLEIWLAVDFSVASLSTV